MHASCPWFDYQEGINSPPVMHDLPDTALCLYQGGPLILLVPLSKSKLDITQKEDDLESSPSHGAMANNSSTYIATSFFFTAERKNYFSKKKKENPMLSIKNKSKSKKKYHSLL
jgi:hypothetical protein